MAPDAEVEYTNGHVKEEDYVGCEGHDGVEREQVDQVRELTAACRMHGHPFVTQSHIEHVRLLSHKHKHRHNAMASGLPVGRAVDSSSSNAMPSRGGRPQWRNTR